MINDNPLTWVVLAVLMVLFLRYLFKAWLATKPADFWNKRDLGCVSSAKINLDWSDNKKKRFF